VYLVKAKQLLHRGTEVADSLGYFSAAAREAYMAAFHAAQAIIQSRQGKVAKTHRGVRTALARIAQADTRFEPTFTTFLGNGYRLMEKDDYDVATDAPITRDDARNSLGTATRLVAHAEWLLAQEPPAAP
jgi:uncharacterized protein (UPF0332 family)